MSKPQAPALLRVPRASVRANCPDQFLPPAPGVAGKGGRAKSLAQLHCFSTESDDTARRLMTRGGCSIVFSSTAAAPSMLMTITLY